MANDDDEAEKARLLALEAMPERRATVRPVGSELHPLAEKVRAALSKAEPDPDYGAIRCEARNLPYVRVSPEGVPRALSIVDAMARAAEVRSWKWEPRPDGQSGGAWLVVERHRFGLGVEETMNRQRPPARKRRDAALGAGDFDSWLKMIDRQSREPEWIFKGTNRFSVRESSTVILQDATYSYLEERFHRFPTRLLDLVFQARAEMRRREAHEAQAREAEARRELIARSRDLSVVARERLETQAKAWEQVSRLRAFIAAVEAKAGATGVEAGAWAAWAFSVADALDPLRDLPRLVERETAIIAEIADIERQLKRS